MLNESSSPFDLGETLSGTILEKGSAFSEANIRRFEGKLLTLIDASFSDRDQRKAMKDVIRGQLLELYGDQFDSMRELARSMAEEIGDKEVIDFIAPPSPHTYPEPAFSKLKYKYSRSSL